MARAKITHVLLVVPEHGMQQDFALDQAEYLLKMKNNGGWQLPEDSEFELTENGLEYRTNPKGNKGKQKGADPVKSESTSGQD